MLGLLEKAANAYYSGSPFMSDEEFDTLATIYGFNRVGHDLSKGIPHYARMYSLQKVYDEKPPISGELVETIKLDGAALSLLYNCGDMVRVLTRGDGIKGQDCTHLFQDSNVVPLHISDNAGFVQITGELLADKNVDNARNMAAGALGLKDPKEFASRNLTFVAYGTTDQGGTYTEDMRRLHSEGFTTVLSSSLDIFPSDGKVFRIDSNEEFNHLGHTAKHPRGAYALKLRSDVAIEKTTLRSVEWGVGASGKVTPVAHFDTIIIDDAKISKATLNNAGFIEELGLDIGDEILVTRSGGIIPKILGVHNKVDN